MDVLDIPKILSGEAIVAKGVIKVEASLPEIGLKDVTPNGSWLEEKQIQAALEARKHLIEVERIEKCGSVSHATWHDDLKLAEVTQMSGGYWQYLGHSVGKVLYLRPEEVLYLMEINCLLLKHNEVTVSLQKAYSLLLNETMTHSQYRVYSSLSRLGYKVFRHKKTKVNKDKSPPWHEKQSVNNAENGNKHLTIDIPTVDNVNQSLTDSSVEILDSKVNENNDVPIAENNSQTLLLTQNTDEIKNTESNEHQFIKKEDENTENDTNQIVNEYSYIITRPKIETENNENIETVQNGEQENIDNNRINDTVNENTELTHVKTQNNELPNSHTDGNKTNNGMDIDETIDTRLVVESTTMPITDELKIPNKDIQNKPEQIAAKEISKDTESNTETHNVCIKNENEISTGSMEVSSIVQEASNPGVQFIEECNGKHIHSDITIEIDSADSDIAMDLDTPKSLELKRNNTEIEMNNVNKVDHTLSDMLINKRNQIFHNYVNKLRRLTSRQCKPSVFKNLETHFENIPEIVRKEVILINVPEPRLIPKNIFVNKSSYVLNMRQIKRRSLRSESIESAAYNSSDEVNGNHIRRIRSNSATEISQNLQFVNNIRFPPRQTLFFRPFNFYRPHNNHFVQFNMFFQRPCFPNMYFQSRFQYQQRANHPLIRSVSHPNNLNFNPSTNNDTRKRLRTVKATHLQSIKNLAVRLKQLIMSGNTHIQNIEALHRLLYAYNTRYKERLRLSKDFEVVSDENIVETIDLEDDDESASKRLRLTNDDDMFDENLNLLRELALKLKDLEAKNRVTSKHKRAMSKAIKTFNKSYDADICMNNNYEVINKRYINLETDSESDCVVNEPKKVHKKKKLRNPFNILKRRSEKQAANNPSTSKENKSEESDHNNVEMVEDPKYNERIKKIFNKNWLPQETDFGRAEVVHKNVMNSRFTDAVKEEYLFNFMKNHFDEFNNWLEAKIAFLQHLEETDIAFQNDSYQIRPVKESIPSGLKPLIDAEDCSDMASVLEKLRIIKSNKEIKTESTLNIHFDVYNRDVQNFRKTNPPKPHFRIICLEEASIFPWTADIVALHSQYEDNVNIVFAIVGTCSISYLQINPIDLPVYVPHNDMD